MFPLRPQTPVNLITATPSEPANLLHDNSSLYQQLLRSPLSPIDGTETSQSLKPDASSPESKDSIETIISNLLLVIEDNKPLDLVQLKSALQKCLVSLSHYKLQAEIMKYNQLENSKRNEIENKLIQAQVDHLLLKSPFKPEIKGYIAKPNSTPRSSLKNHINDKVSKPKLKLVEKLHNNTPCGLKHVQKPSTNSRNSYKNDNEFNNCIKIFHLEKS